MTQTNGTLLISDIISLESIKNVCIRVLSSYPHVSCYLFGSYAKGSPNRASDIDLLLLFDREAHTYQIISQIKNALHDSFLAVEKFCNPIYGYKNRINSDSSILFRQYIHYGILVYGRSMLPLMKNETQEELESLEYTHYWRPMYLRKIKTIEQMIKSDIDLESSSFAWQSLFLIAYWYVKAELTLVDKQYSLNNFSLLYIYEDLLEINLDSQQKEVLNVVQKQREDYRACEYFQAPNISPAFCFDVIKAIVE